MAVGGSPIARAFRNTVGTAWQGQGKPKRIGPDLILHNARAITHGLGPSSPDVIGWRQVTITPAMVGRTAAVFFGLEVKAERGGVIRPGQPEWIETLRGFGGMGGIVRSPEDARRVLHLGAG